MPLARQLQTSPLSQRPSSAAGQGFAPSAAGSNSARSAQVPAAAPQYAGPNAILMGHQSKGAGLSTARKQGYSRGGVATSEAMAMADLGRAEGMEQVFVQVGSEYGLPPALLAAVASRETRVGSSSLLGSDGYSALDGYGYGVMQVDRRYHRAQGGPRSAEHVRHAARILKDNLERMKREYPDLPESKQLQIAVAAYNAGQAGALSGADRGNSDRNTYDGDYGNDVWARARAFAPHIGGLETVEQEAAREATAAAPPTTAGPSPVSASPVSASPVSASPVSASPAGPASASSATTSGRSSISQILAELRAMRAGLAGSASPGSGGAATAGPSTATSATTGQASADAWVGEALQSAPVPANGVSGDWGGVASQLSALGASTGEAPATTAAAPELRSHSDLAARLAAVQAKLEARDGRGAQAEAHAIATEARARIAAQDGDVAALQALVAQAGQAWTRGATLSTMGSGALGVTDRGRADMDRLARAASTPWFSDPRGKCYAAVAGYSSSAYVNEAGGRWKQLADRIPQSHSMWAVSFAHWLQETGSGQRAARELGFEIRESDGRTRLGDYLKAHPELKGAIVVIPFGQEGTASQEWNAAAHYGDRKWGAGVGDISVVTSIGERGATYMADGPVPHNNATMWWVVFPK